MNTHIAPIVTLWAAVKSLVIVVCESKFIIFSWMQLYR
jgi:hypothetical protein